MRRRMRLVAAASLVAAGSVVVAPPAQADHVIDIFIDGQCRWGKMANPVRIDLFTPKVEVERDASGRVTSYTCYFKNIPEFVAAEDRYYHPDGPSDWYLPSRPITVTSYCWSPDRNATPRDGREGVGVGKITPSGNAAITCTQFENH